MYSCESWLVLYWKRRGAFFANLLKHVLPKRIEMDTMMEVDAIVQEIVEETVSVDGFEQRDQFLESPMERHTK